MISCAPIRHSVCRKYRPEEKPMPARLPGLETLLAIPHVDPDYGFDLSPDGREVAFAWNRSGQWEIYTLALDGSGPPRLVSRGPGAKFNPRYAQAESETRPLAYALDLDGSESFDLYARYPGGDQTNLTPGTPDALQPNYAWSPGGDEIAFLSDRAGHFAAYVMPAAGGAARLVFDPGRPAWDVHWAPGADSSAGWLAVEVEGRGQDYYTYVVPLSGGRAEIIGQGGEPIPARDARWVPGSIHRFEAGRHLAFVSDLAGWHNLGLYDVDTGQIEWLTGGEGDKEQPAWSPGPRLAYVLSHGPLSELAVLDLASRQTVRYRLGPGVHHRPRFTADGQGLVFLFESPRQPADLWHLSLTDGTFRQLSHSLPPGVEPDSFVLPDLVHYPSLDGTSVPALLYRAGPGSGDAAAAVVYVHGGPNWLAQAAWDPLVQHMVGRGWAVLAPNYRGSTGYGREWQLANRFDLGGGDTGDVAAGADYLVGRGLADPGRIAVTGRSYGGYLTMTSLTQYPDRWAAGSAVVPFLNWFTGHANSRPDLQHWDLENFGHPERDRELYYERSPFFFLDRIGAPVQLICGAHDPRCPASESVQAHEALRAQGKPCDLVLYEDEGHSFYKTENVVNAEKRRMEFLAQVLEG
jgi:dipeptidyl aminopeptidase/acylaminoacyl peptidase